jgi:hypothetical protein
MHLRRFPLFFLLGLYLTVSASPAAQGSEPARNGGFVIGNWQMQYADKVSNGGETIAAKGFSPSGWYKATVPGTVLATLVDNHVYPDPDYGGNDRPQVIPDSLARTAIWYRTEFTVPKSYAGRHVWLHFDGINYSAAIWINGKQVGSMRGAFIRGAFDISYAVRPGAVAALAVFVSPQPHPGVPHEHTLLDGVGQNGGVTALDGPTFLSTIGWDWLPAVPDRNTGLWRKVWVSASGPVVIRDPQVTTDLKVPDLDAAGVGVKATLENVSDKTEEGVLRGTIGDIAFTRHVTLPAHSARTIAFDPTTDASLLLHHPRLWWPNGYGPQSLYTLHLAFTAGNALSEEQDVIFGVRKITYTVPSTGALAFVVNGVPVFIRGGDWGLDDAMKHIPMERLDAQIRMHKLANLNMIRNWVGQSTSEDFFELCDKYGLLVWDEFFQPNPGDGPNPIDLETYMANVRDTILRYRNHPSIAIWCARNEGTPPKEIGSAMSSMLAELDATRLYQSSSSDGRSVRSHGPYRWRVPRDYYWLDEGFKTETGSMSIPTLESIQGMMPEKDWSAITDDWAEHDFAKGAASGDLYPGIIEERYGAIENLADFVRKSQLANYEAFHAMYEGRNAEMFHPTTGVLTWMSHPAHPSFVWQLYHYDLEPNASFFAVKNASEMVHVQLNQITGMVQIVNNLPTPLAGSKVHVKVFNLNGSLASEQVLPAKAAPSSVSEAGEVIFHEPMTGVFFVRLELTDSADKFISRNFYWLAFPERVDHFTALDAMPKVELHATAIRADKDGASIMTVTLHNPTPNIALMIHLQLRRQTTGARVLPTYYDDNYVSLAGGEDRTITIQCTTSDLQNSAALVVVDGWNVSVAPATSAGIAVQLNENAQVDHWPHTGLPFQKH